jgi:hypothetical protein
MPKVSDIKLRAVIAGALTDNVATLGIMLMLMAALSSQGLPDDEVALRMKSLSGVLLSFIIGMSCTGLGGYVAGRMARQAEVLHGAIVAVLGIVLVLVFPEEGPTAWHHIAGLAGMLPAGMAGGYLALKRRVPTAT